MQSSYHTVRSSYLERPSFAQMFCILTLSSMALLDVIILRETFELHLHSLDYSA